MAKLNSSQYIKCNLDCCFQDSSEEEVNLSIKTFFCPNDTYNDMATLFFNPQESAILQLFHQEGECESRFPWAGGVMGRKVWLGVWLRRRRSLGVTLKASAWGKNVWGGEQLRSHGRVKIKYL